MDQRLVDSEMRATRKQLVQSLRRRIGTDGSRLLDEDFLALADPQAVLEAIVDGTVLRGLCDRADAQIVDGDRRVLRIIACRGFSAKFVDTFSTLALTTPTACAAAVLTGAPVVVDNVERSEIFVGQDSLGPILREGSRAVCSYPLFGAGDTHADAVLSFHFDRPLHARDKEKVAIVADAAAAAEEAIRRLTASN